MSKALIWMRVKGEGVGAAGFCAGSRIRTYVAIKARLLQSRVFDRSTIPAYLDSLLLIISISALIWDKSRVSEYLMWMSPHGIF